jgi:hypothetical protein
MGRKIRSKRTYRIYEMNFRRWTRRYAKLCRIQNDNPIIRRRRGVLRGNRWERPTESGIVRADIFWGSSHWFANERAWHDWQERRKAIGVPV